MKKLFCTAVLFILFLSITKAQIVAPVHWSYAAKRLNKDEAVVFIKASIDPGWHIYSQNMKDGGPVKTTFTFNHSKDYDLIGKTLEPKPVTRNEKVFGMDVSFFEASVIFQQKIKLRSPSATISGTLEYMTCNDQKCLPPDDVTFNIPVK